MSSNDLSRIQSIGGARALGREPSLQADKTPPYGPQAMEKAGEAAVKVETNPALKAGSAPVAQDRVAEIRAAVNSGNYPLLPAKVADAIIAAPMLLGRKS